MLITFSSPTLATVSNPHRKIQARFPDTYLSVDWKSPVQCRLKLLQVDNSPPGQSPPASNQAHEAFIRAVLNWDPRARIRTARAVYNGRDDYLRLTANKA